MARIMFPIDEDRLTASPSTNATLYANQAGTVLADVQTYPGGVAISGSVVTTDSSGNLPLFYGPASGVDELFIQVGSGAIRPIHAHRNERVDVLTDTVTAASATYAPVTVLIGTGIDTTGVTDSTTAIQALATAAIGPVVGVPGAIYKIGTITLKNGSHLIGNGATIASLAASGQGVFVASANTDLEIEGWTVTGALGSALLKATACSRITVRRNKVTNVGLLATHSAGGDVYSTASTTENTAIDVSDNVAGGTASGTIGCVSLFYVNGARVRGNQIAGYGSGIEFWGGDANSSSANGALVNTRKAQAITITGNIVTGASGGGIWGSMGQDVVVAGNVVESCADVGIDFEGCFSATASGNTVRDCTNGQLSTFWLNKDVLFIGNTVQVSDPTHHLMSVNNAAQDANATFGNISVNFVGNSFTCTSGLGSTVLEAVNTLLIANNTLRDVQIKTTGNNMHNVYVLDNNLTFSVQGAAFNAIEVTRNNRAGGVGGTTAFSRIVGNAISTLGAQPATSIGILASENDFNTSPTMEIKDNTIQAGFPGADIKTSWSGTNAGTRAVFGIVQNLVGGSSIVKDDTGAATASIQVLHGNQDSSYTAVGAA